MTCQGLVLTIKSAASIFKVKVISTRAEDEWFDVADEPRPPTASTRYIHMFVE